MKLQLHRRLDILLENVGDMALKRRARHIIEGIDPEDGYNIVDVGCGDGYYLHLLSNLGIKLQLTGMDVDPNALKSAKANLKGKDVKLINADLLQKLPFSPGTFDRAVMSEVAEHLQSDVKGLKEVNRILKKDGVLVLTVPNHNYPFLWDPVNWILEHAVKTHIEKGFWAGIWNQHKRLYTPLQIEKVVKKAGFKIEKIESLTFWCLPFNHNLIDLVARNLYGGNFSSRVTKAVSKYETGEVSRPLLIRFAFRLVNILDRLNDFYQPREKGVGILVMARK
jgi:2-polyprenyl-6-hydroxyphenyl methylase / 3-demethylubiquinone-9 3-methyltransferase